MFALTSISVFVSLHTGINNSKYTHTQQKPDTPKKEEPRVVVECRRRVSSHRIGKIRSHKTHKMLFFFAAFGVRVPLRMATIGAKDVVECQCIYTLANVRWHRNDPQMERKMQKKKNGGNLRLGISDSYDAITHFRHHKNVIEVRMDAYRYIFLCAECLHQCIFLVLL